MRKYYTEAIIADGSKLRRYSATAMTWTIVQHLSAR